MDAVLPTFAAAESSKPDDFKSYVQIWSELVDIEFEDSLGELEGDEGHASAGESVASPTYVGLIKFDIPNSSQDALVAAQHERRAKAAAVVQRAVRRRSGGAA